MKIALASARIVDRDIKYNLSRMEHYMTEAKLSGADLVWFGEAFLQGFNALSWQYEEDKKMAMDAGMNGHVSKPIDVNVLEKQIINIFKKVS